MKDLEGRKKSSGWYRTGSATMRQVNCVEHLMADGWLDGTELTLEEHQYIGTLSASRASKLIATGFKRRDRARDKGLVKGDERYPTRPPSTYTDADYAHANRAFPD